MLDTTVTIGYDTPWRQVQAMLLEAARAHARASSPSRAPHVFQTALTDFYVEYRLVCQAVPTEPRPRAPGADHAARQHPGRVQRARRADHVAALHAGPGGGQGRPARALACAAGAARRIVRLKPDPQDPEPSFTGLTVSPCGSGSAGRFQVLARPRRLTSGTRRSERMHLRQMPAVAHLHAEEHREHVAAVGPLHRHRVDVGVGIGDGERRDPRAGRGGRRRAGACRSRTRPARRAPIRRRRVRPASTPLFLQRDAVARVHEQALAAAELADDRVAGNRPAALRVLDRHALDAAQRERPRLRGRRRRARSGLAGDLASAPARRRTTAACRGRCRRGCRAGSSRRIPSRAPSQRSQLIASGSTLSVASACLSSRSPSAADSFCCSALQEMADARARLAGGDERQPRRVRPRVGAVMISTWSPFLSSVRSGSSSSLIRAATQWLPMSVCTPYAKSTAVAPRGSAMILPFGVNT